MEFEQILQTYGYAALFAGTFFEGETFLVLSGYAAHRGHMLLWLVLLVGGGGGFLGSQFWYEVGRRYGGRLLEKRPGWRPRVEQASDYLDEKGTWFVFSFRFIYGIRTISPVAIGMSGYPAGRYLAVNVVSTLVWVTVVGLLGYGFGEAATSLLDRVADAEYYLLAGVGLVGLLVALYHLYRRRQSG
jgi:membrane protein DedA with SNARE-associated domain